MFTTAHILWRHLQDPSMFLYLYKIFGYYSTEPLTRHCRGERVSWYVSCTKQKFLKPCFYFKDTELLAHH